MATSTLNAEVRTTGVTKANSELKNLSRSAKAADTSVDNLGRSSTKAERELNGLTRSSSDLSGALSGVSEGITALAGAIGVGAFFNNVVATQREFDTLNAGLVTFTGSAENAAEAFGILNNFASTTPFALQQSVNAFNTLVALGLTPSEEALISYGNTASALGEDLTRFVEAVADASVGEFERLKAFGIKSEKEADKVRFTFRGVTTEIRNSAEEIEGYLIDLGQNEFAGAMQERVNTLDGAISNLGDSWSNLFRTISESGVGGAIEEQARNATSFLDQLSSGIRVFFGEAINTDEIDRQLEGVQNNLKTLRLELSSKKKFGGGLSSLWGDPRTRDDIIADIDVLVDRQQELIDQRAKLSQQSTALEDLVPESAQGGGGSGGVSASEQRQIDAAQRELERIDALNDTKLEAIDRFEQDQIDKIIEFNNQRLITDEEFQSALTEITLNAAMRRGELEREEIQKTLDAEKKATEEKKALQDKLVDQSLAAVTAIGGAQSDAGRIAVATSAFYANQDLIISQAAAIGKAYAQGGPLGALALVPETIAAFAPLIATVSSVASAREQGGALGVGQTSTIAERGQLEVITPSSNSRVRTAQQMRSIMGEDSGGNNVNVTVINQGSNTEVSAEENDQGEIIVLIRDTVSQDFSNNNSKITKSLRANNQIQAQR